MIFVLLYQIFVGLLAYKNAMWSNPEEKHKIKHWLNGLFHLIAAGLVGYYTGWEKGVSLLLITRVVFDTTMNVLRHLGVGYISPERKSLVDKVEAWIIFKLVEIVYRRKTIISERDIDWVAIGFRIVILITGIILLFI